MLRPPRRAFYTIQTHDPRSKKDITSRTRSTISSPSATPTTTLHIQLAYYIYIGPCLSTDMSHKNAFTHAPCGLHVPLNPCMHCRHCELFRHVRIAPDGFPRRLRHASHRLSLPYQTLLTSQFILLPLQLHHGVVAPSKPFLSSSTSQHAHTMSMLSNL